MSQHPVVVVAPLRTAIGTFGGTLKEIPAPELGAAAIRAAVARAALDPEEIGTVVMDRCRHWCRRKRSTTSRWN